MSNTRWARNDVGGLTLQRQRVFHVNNLPVFADWLATADVFKAKKGDRWVVRVANSHAKFDQYTAYSLRDAMRMAKLFVGLKHGD